MSRPALLEIGKLGRPHGVRGDLHVHLTTDRHDRLHQGAVVVAKGQPLTVRTVRPQGDHWVVGFAEITDRTTAERWTQTPLMGEPIDDPDAMWVDELIGARVVERDGTERGVCVGVLANPAHDLLELDSGALVPMPFVDSITDRTVTINPPSGLFD